MKLWNQIPSSIWVPVHQRFVSLPRSSDVNPIPAFYVGPINKKNIFFFLSVLYNSRERTSTVQLMVVMLVTFACLFYTLLGWIFRYIMSVRPSVLLREALERGDLISWMIERWYKKKKQQLSFISINSYKFNHIFFFIIQCKC